jgi:hypothetical protein
MISPWAMDGVARRKKALPDQGSGHAADCLRVSPDFSAPSTLLGWLRLRLCRLSARARSESHQQIAPDQTGTSPMSPSKISLLAIAVASIGFAVGVSRFATAATQPIDDLASNEGIYVDKGNFKVMRGMAKTDPTAQIMKLGARPVEEGAIIFRSGDQLYIVDAVPAGGARMLNSFRDAFAPPG